MPSKYPCSARNTKLLTVFGARSAYNSMTMSPFAVAMVAA